MMREMKVIRTREVRAAAAALVANRGLAHADLAEKVIGGHITDLVGTPHWTITVWGGEFAVALTHQEA